MKITFNFVILNILSTKLKFKFCQEKKGVIFFKQAKKIKFFLNKLKK